LKITREDSSQLQVSLNIELESDDIEPYLERSYKRVVNRVQIPGFRPGKAPRYIVQTFMGKEAMCGRAWT
jgi:trigger factor